MSALPPRTTSLEQRSSPLVGLPPLLVPKRETGTGTGEDGTTTFQSPLQGLPPLIVPSRDAPEFGAPPSYHLSAQSPASSLSSRGKLPALPSPPSEALPLPPTHALPAIPRSNGNGNGNGTSTPTADLRLNGARRSPSPLSPFSGHGEIKPSYDGLQGLGLGPIAQPLSTRGQQPRSVSSPDPRVQIIASSQRPAHKDLPPIITHPPRSVSSRPTQLQHQPFPTPHLLSPGIPASPGFSPTNVAIDSLIEEMAEDSPPAREHERDTPVRKTSILDRPRPRTTSRSSSHRGDMPTPTPRKTSFPPDILDTSSSDVNPYFRPSVKITDVITHQRIQQVLLPHLSIASFLALLGALDKRWRRSVSGEMVGRWVVREWGLTLGHGVAWPGLGVWEGFLESLLHTPDAYPSYGQHFHPLLRHLSLSHTLIVLFLRSLPPTAFPTIPPFPFEDDATSTTGLTSLSHSSSVRDLAHSVSTVSLRQRTISGPGSEYSGNGAGGRMPFVPKAERVVELVMPSPLSAIPSDSQELLASPTFADNSKARKRRSSLGSNSFVSWRDPKSPHSGPLSPGRQQGIKGKGTMPPPVSFPSAKRYVFKGFGEPSFGHSRKRNSFDGAAGPGSIFSVDEAGPSLYGDSAVGSTFPSRQGLGRTRLGFLGEQQSLSTKQSSSGGRHSPSTSSLARFNHGGYDDRTNTSSPTFGRIRASTPQPVEPAFQRPIPYVVGRCPILRVFVPLSPQVPDWPCAEGARRVRHELERCGAWGKLRLGDVVINTALKDPLAPRNWMLFVPTVAPYLVPLEYRFSPDGHLPAYFDAFQVPPSYYYPLLSPPYIIFPDLTPWADQALPTIRLAFERSDITTTRGEKVVAKRYLHVCGFEITPEAGHLACEEWQGMVTLEAEGTAEGRTSLLRRLGRTANESRVQAQRGPWEIIRDKSLGGTVWLRLIPDKTGPTSP